MNKIKITIFHWAALITFITVVCIIILEVGSTLIVKIKFHLDRTTIDSRYDLVMTSLPFPDDGAFSINGKKRLNLGRDPHPFFGYTNKRNSVGFNNLGFSSYLKYPHHKDEREFVIAGFGGSFTEQLFWNGPAMEILEQLLLPVLKEKGFNKVTFLNFGISAWRQPQQFYAFLYFLDSFDMAITIDGFNEISAIRSNLDRNYPIDFPNAGVWVPLLDSVYTPQSLRIANVILDKQEDIIFYSWLLKNSLFKKSMFMHLIWQTIVDRKLATISELHKKMESKAWLDYATSADTEAQEQPIIIEYFQNLEKYVAFTNDLAQKEHKYSLHFLQPNQYVKDSKMFTAEEKELALSDPVVKGTVAKYYPELQSMTASLRKSGLAAYSLVDVFYDVPVTVYTDNCCHINTLGNQLVAKELGRVIKEYLVSHPEIKLAK